jgi:hypothetical protein
MPNSLVADLTRETIDFIYTQTRRKKNKQKIQYVMNYLTNLIFSDLQPYLYTILAVLILMFLINLFQFYYYVRLFLKNASLQHISLSDSFYDT